MNKIVLCGRLTKEPELKYSQSNVAMCSFTLAVERDFKDKDGNKECDFINCISYKQSAEIISKYVHKGNKFLVNGRLQIRSYKGNDGTTKYATEVIVDGFDFIESKQADGIEVETKTTTKAEAPQGFTILAPDDEDVPF